MVIDERYDIVVWASTLLVLLLLGARAWAVETATSHHYRTSGRARVLTWAAGVSLVVLFGLLAMQGGIAFTQAVMTGTEPEDFVTIVDSEGRADGPDDDQGAPPPDVNPPGPDPGAPAVPNPPGPDTGGPASGPGAAGPDSGPAGAGAGTPADPGGATGTGG